MITKMKYTVNTLLLICKNFAFIITIYNQVFLNITYSNFKEERIV